MSGILYNLLVILNLLSPESQLWSKNDASVKSTLPPRFWSVGIVFVTFVGLLAVVSKIKSKILHPEKEYFFSVFPGLMIVIKEKSEVRNQKTEEKRREEVTTDFSDCTD